ncbi:RNA polymerase II transcription factor complex subunit [Moesziomyces antarcticus T-34]|uniref:RNA polymerase II transcription factor complex subunit n=1 Tax=Pseudozyma antarctica (strain T-34) TaxID=1151754 RepID=M9MH82_PSEA3|nr:RNA polymerase II transcription factor complex subunit [Moesziomyces antarcticus T-34]
MRRGPGLAALDRSLHSSTAYNTLGNDLTASQLTELRQQLDLFSTSLRQFSSQHRHEIRKNAEFRHAFQKMCYSIGVDPLSSSTRGAGGLAGLWSDMLGLGDWQYELGVQIIDVCVSTRTTNGGVIAMDDLIRRVTLLRTGTSTKTKTNEAPEITEDDIVRSIKMLAPLGCGYEVFSLGNGEQKMVRSVPRELDTDTMVVLSILLSAERGSDELPHLTEDALVSGPRARGWSRDRARAVLQNMSLTEGMLWIDEQCFPPRYYSLATLPNA